MQLILLLIGHFLGDFTFQIAKLVDLKHKKIKYLIIHTLIYTAVLSIPILMFGRFSFLNLLVVALLHFLIDYIRIKIDKKLTPYYQQVVFIIDQLLHIGILVILTLFNNELNDFGLQLNNFVLSYISFNDLVEYSIITLAFIIALSPSSVLIKHTLRIIDNRQENNSDEICESQKDSNNVGALIGKLERVVIIILGLMQLYSSIALVLTAKSLARFKQLENKDFAEKYLVGTLLSLIISLVLLFLINLY